MYMAKCGATKIKCDLVIMKGQKLKNLYRLVGNTILDRVVLSIPIAAESSTDDTKLWHMGFGHIGECGILELHKKNMLKVQAKFLQVLCVW